MSKVVVDGRPDQFFGVFGWPLVQVDTQMDRSVRGEFLGPAYDEFFCVVVEILFNKRRRVHRIEQLARVAHFQAYDVRMPPVRRGSDSCPDLSQACHCLGSLLTPAYNMIRSFGGSCPITRLPMVLSGAQVSPNGTSGQHW